MLFLVDRFRAYWLISCYFLPLPGLRCTTNPFLYRNASQCSVHSSLLLLSPSLEQGYCPLPSGRCANHAAAGLAAFCRHGPILFSGVIVSYPAAVGVLFFASAHAGILGGLRVIMGAVVLGQLYLLFFGVLMFFFFVDLFFLLSFSFFFFSSLGYSVCSRFLWFFLYGFCFISVSSRHSCWCRCFLSRVCLNPAHTLCLSPSQPIVSHQLWAGRGSAALSTHSGAIDA